MKNGVQLTPTTDYVFGPNSLNLVTPAQLTDEFVIIFPPIKTFDVTALYCSIKGRIDRFCPWGFFTAQAQVDTGIIDVVWEGNPNISRINNATTLGIYANTGVSGGSKSLRIAGAGTGLVELDRPRGINLPTSATGLASGQFWNDSGTLKVAT
ncbi:hypothetical protein O206_00055 [Ochrobactrum sp. EGD-AQ16]|nr:hypothetical protein O206_00055 [Ochrobactrum sp. EGD-AQ16]